MIPISFVVVIVLFILLRKPPLNRAFNSIVDVTFVYIPKESLNRYSHSDKPADKNKVQNLGDIHYIKKRTTQLDCSILPYMNDCIYLWAMFLSGTISQLICFALGLIPIFSSGSYISNVLCKEVDHFSSIAVGIILVMIRFGITSSFNRRFHRRFAVMYGVFFGLVSFFLIRKMYLGIFEFRPILIDLFGIAPLFVDIVMSVLVGIVAYALSTPMIYELFAYQMIHTKPHYIFQFAFANEFYDGVIKYLRFFTNLAFNMTPLLPIAFYFVSRLVITRYSDLVFSIAFVVIELFIAVSKLYGLKSKCQILTFAALRYIVGFNIARTYDSGKDGLAAINRSLNMLPVSSLSMSVHPMIVIFLSSLYLSSFVMNGAGSMVARHISLFLIAIMDWIMSGSRVLRLFIENVD